MGLHICGEYLLGTDMCKSESSLKEESRALSVDSSKAYSKPTAFNRTLSIVIVVLLYKRINMKSRFATIVN